MRAVTLAVAAAFLLRAAFGLGYWTGKPLTHDEREYLTLAANLVHGRGFTQELPNEPAPAHVQRFGRAPLYPLFLAPLTLTSPELRAGRLPPDVPAGIKLAQAAVGALGIWLIALIVGRVAGSRAAASAAWIGAAYPPLVWMCAYALSEALYSTLALATVWLLGAVTDGAARHDAPAAPAWFPAAAGFVAGLAALTRPAMLFYLPIAALLLIWRAPALRLGVRRAIVFGLLALLPIVPWTLRNLGAEGRVVLIASEGGITFWTGNHREAIGEGDLAANPHLKVRNQEFRTRYAGLSESELEPLYYREALDFIRADPGWWLGLLARKAFFTAVPVGPSYRLHSPLYFWASALSYGALLPLAVIGLVRQRHLRPLALLGLAASAVIVGLIFFPQERFRIPVVDPTLVAGAALLRRPR